MTLASNTIIKKYSGDSIEGVITYYQTLINDVYSNTYHSSNVPVFNGRSDGAIPSNHLGSYDRPSLSISDSVITASSLWASIYSIATGFNKVRKFQSYRYYNTDGNQSLTNSASGKFIVNTSFPSVPSGWTVSGSNVSISQPNDGVTSGLDAVASSINNTLQSGYNNWCSQCRDSNVITYKYYACHTQCHSSCHGSRGRR